MQTSIRRKSWFLLSGILVLAIAIGAPSLRNTVKNLKKNVPSFPESIVTLSTVAVSSSETHTISVPEGFAVFQVFSEDRQNLELLSRSADNFNKFRGKLDDAINQESVKFFVKKIPASLNSAAYSVSSSGELRLQESLKEEAQFLATFGSSYFTNISLFKSFSSKYKKLLKLSKDKKYLTIDVKSFYALKSDSSSLIIVFYKSGKNLKNSFSTPYEKAFKLVFGKQPAVSNVGSSAEHASSDSPDSSSATAFSSLTAHQPGSSSTVHSSSSSSSSSSSVVSYASSSRSDFSIPPLGICPPYKCEPVLGNGGAQLLCMNRVVATSNPDGCEGNTPVYWDCPENENSRTFKKITGEPCPEDHRCVGGRCIEPPKA